MNLLLPAIESIRGGYAAWLDHDLPPADAASTAAPGPAEPAPPAQSPLPPMLADAVRRQVAARAHRRPPAPGDIVVLAPPSGAARGEPPLPIAVLLDQPIGARWCGWLVGAHVDYAGDRDLVLDASMIDGGTDPAPLAGMVLCWDRVALTLAAALPVLHRLTPAAMAAVRRLERGTQAPESPPAPGRMCVRELETHVVVTGTPYLRDDPRTPYLQLARELARRLSEPALDGPDHSRHPGLDGPDA